MNRTIPYYFPAFGKRLKRHRVAIGVKQDALAEALGVAQTTVSRWESGAQVPAEEMQKRAIACLSVTRAEDATLRRLVEGASYPVHLVDEADHRCLAYSSSRAKDWNTTNRSLLGVSLWQFATEEIQRAERELDDQGWWDDLTPTPKHVITSRAVYPELTVSAGGMMWERLYLADGTPVRLVTGTGPHA